MVSLGHQAGGDHFIHHEDMVLHQACHHTQEDISPPTTEGDTCSQGSRVSREQCAGMGKVHSMRHVSVRRL